MKKKKKKQQKSATEGSKLQIPDENLKDQKKEKDEESPYGGMDLKNFKKNLGCGS